MAYKFYILIIHHKQGFQTYISLHQAVLSLSPAQSPLFSGKGRTEKNKGDQHLSCHLAATCLHWYLPKRETGSASHSSRVTKAIKEKECHQINPHRSMQKHRDTAFAKTGFLSPNLAPSPLLSIGSDSWSYLLFVYTAQENQCHQQTKAFSNWPFIHNGWRVSVRETDDGRGISSTQVRKFLPDFS